MTNDNYGMKLLRGEEGIEYFNEKGGDKKLLSYLNTYLGKYKDGSNFDVYKNVKSVFVLNREVLMRLGSSDVLRITVSNDSHYLYVTGTIGSATFYLDGKDGFYQPLYPVFNDYLLEKITAISPDIPLKQLVVDMDEYQERLDKYASEYPEDEEAEIKESLSPYYEAMEQAIVDAYDYCFGGLGDIAIMVKSFDDAIYGEGLNYDDRTLMVELAQKPNEIYSVITHFINAIGLY